MDALSQFLVNKPLHVLLVSGVYFLLWTILRLVKSRSVRHPNAILLPALFALVYASWEWLVTTRTPEANIRVDLMLIWPLQTVITVLALVKTFIK